ncbi:MAG TPA: STAS domain-containing protein [Streptosporangiaceae bacterium]|nr:STAS domain-containing protein [Streptosporangiaceae bacterium]
MASLDNFPVDWAHPVAVVTMPDEIDIANAEDVRDTLLAVLNRGITTLIVDLTGTTFCARAGAAAFARAHQRARASGAQVRLVARAPIVRRLLALTSVDHLMPVFDSLSAAREAQVRPGPSRTEAAPAPAPPPPSRSPRPAPGA